MQWGEREKKGGKERERERKKEKEKGKNPLPFFFFFFFPTPQPLFFFIPQKTKPLFFFIFSSVCVRQRNTLPQSRLWYDRKRVGGLIPPPPSFFFSFFFSHPCREKRRRKKKKGGERGEGIWVTSLLAFSHKGQDWCWHVCKSMTSKCPPFSSPFWKFPFPTPSHPPFKGGGGKGEGKEGKKTR